MASTEITISKEQFQDFQRLQKGGLYNMADPAIREILEISKGEHLYIMQHYEELEKKYGGI